jgi:PKD domain
VTIFARLFSSSTVIRSAPLRARTLSAALAVSCAAAFLLSAAPAGAVVTTVGEITAGVQPRIGSQYVNGESPKTYANPNGNPVLHSTHTYAIYWDPTDHYWSEWQAAIDEYFSDAAADSSNTTVFAVDTQYTDKSNEPAHNEQTFMGGYTDTHAYPSSKCTDPDPFAPEDQIAREFEGAPGPLCLTSAQVASELEAFMALHKLPKGMDNVYYVLTPPGVTICLDGGGLSGHCSDDLPSNKESYENSFCSYHAAINPGSPATGSANTVVYGVIPWSAGGYGDGDLVNADERPGWECQDGGINPAGEGGHYELEKKKELSTKEKEAAEEAFENMDNKEKAKAIEVEELEGPHEQEPNQKVPCPNSDGTCDYGLSDLIINQLSLEQENIVTDPLLNAWQDEHHYENTDECRFLFGPVLGGSSGANLETKAGTLYDQDFNGGTYYLNDAFNLAAYRLPYPGVSCIHGINLQPKFTAPSPVNSGEIVGFNGMESLITLDAAFDYSASGAPQANYATYSWNFGDGTPVVSGYAPGAPQCETPWLSPCAASVFHSYQYGGTYEVTLTVTDVGGNTASITHNVTVSGPARPEPASPGSGTGGSSGGGSGQSSQTGGSTTGTPSITTPTVPAPVAAASVVPQSLRTALRKGLAVRYSVNEQVAGQFEVLLSQAVARKLGISGTIATNLPAGSPVELVIAKAILVTTKGGRSAVHIEFSKHTAARLAHVHKVALMLRLIVRNAATSNPTTTTVLSNVTLGG